MARLPFAELTSLRYLLTPEDRKRHEHIQEKGKVTGFAVQYETLIEGKWTPVVRFDTAHGVAHKDLYTLSGKKSKILLGPVSYAEALDLADKDIRENWSRYKRVFLSAGRSK